LVSRWLVWLRTFFSAAPLWAGGGGGTVGIKAGSLPNLAASNYPTEVSAGKSMPDYVRLTALSEQTDVAPKKQVDEPLNLVEEIDFDDALDALGEDGFKAVASALEMFRSK
jgi:hypothetical protein